MPRPPEVAPPTDATPHRARHGVSRGIVTLLIPSLAAITLVTMLAFQAIRVGKEQRRLNDQSLRDYATFGATAFATRSANLIIGSADYLLTVGDSANAHGAAPAAVTAQILAVADTAIQCKCGPALIVREVRVLDSTASMVIGSRVNAAYASYGELPFNPASLLVKPGISIRWRLYGGDTNSVLIAVKRWARHSGHAPAIGVVIFDGPSITRELLAPVYRDRPNLIPSALLGGRANDSIIAIEVRSADGRTFARFGSVADSLHRAQLRFAEFNATSIVADLSPAAVSRLQESARSAPSVTLVLFLAAMTALATCLATWFAWRSFHLGRLRMDFASSISHELRTPLTEIMLYAELIESGRTQRAGARNTEQAARTIRGEARRLHQLVENSLHMARAERRLVRVSPTPESLAAIVDDLLESYAPIAARRGVTIEHAGDHSAHASVDPDAIRHILLNVLDNALRYGPAGGTVWVVTARSGAWVALTVEDEGPGIPVDDRVRVFKPYVRLSRDVGQDRTGSGIGLSVVADLVREMRGRVRIEHATREGAREGARVVIELPAVEAEPDAVPQASRFASRAP